MRRPHILAMLLPAALLAGCANPWEPPVVGTITDLASVTVFHRGVFDLAYSGITGKDCSVVRLDRGETYCRPIEPAPTAPPYCTRSLGNVDCWANPYAIRNLAPEVADGPRTLTPAQEADRTRRWPGL